MIRGLNSIHNQAMLPQTNAERKSFAGYVLCLTEFTHHHHAGVGPSPPPPPARGVFFSFHFSTEPHPDRLTGREIHLSRSGEARPWLDGRESRPTQTFP